MVRGGNIRVAFAGTALEHISLTCGAPGVGQQTPEVRRPNVLLRALHAYKYKRRVHDNTCNAFSTDASSNLRNFRST